MGRYFWRGLWTWLPLGMTVAAALWLIKTVDSWLGPATALMVRKIVPEWLLAGWCETGHIPGLSLVVTFAVFTLLGWVTSWYIGQRVVALVDYIATRIPLIKVVYATIRSIGKNVERQTDGSGTGLGKVVRIKEAGYEVLALITNRLTIPQPDGTPQDYYSGITPFFPSSARPILVKVEDAIDTPMKPAQLAEFVASLGTVVPTEWRNLLEGVMQAAAAMPDEQGAKTGPT